jgi:predicted nucleic acid-binding protein
VTEAIGIDAGRRHFSMDRMDSRSETGESVARELPSDDQWVVPTIVQHELARWLTREMSAAHAATTIAFSTGLVVRFLDTDVATKAVDYASEFGLAMADSIISATAMDNGADVLTCDAHFAKLPHVVYLAKGAQ